MVKVLVVAVLSFWLAVVGCGYDRPADVSGPTDCGDGELDDAEECDDGNLSDGDGCDRNCTLELCGNGIQNSNEECDDGNLSDTDACINNCILALCGDGFIWVEREECDDGNAVTEPCPYGLPTCIVCNETCFTVPGVPSFCGDGIQQSAFEVCDDGNLSCGTCSPNCQVVASAKATGAIVVVSVSNIVDGETLALRDGFNSTVIFEFMKDGAVGAGRVAVDISMSVSATDVRNKVRDVINSVAALQITASTSGTTGSIVNLIHDQLTVLGNVAITETVANSSFSVTGMAGGAGGDCSSGQSCRSNADCASNVCQSNACK